MRGLNALLWQQIQSFLELTTEPSAQNVTRTSLWFTTKPGKEKGFREFARRTTRELKKKSSFSQ